jgi:hypothetical protein
MWIIIAIIIFISMYMSIKKIYVDNRMKWNDKVEVNCGPDGSE